MVLWLFERTYLDLKQHVERAGQWDRYSMLCIAPLIRKLLLDGNRSIAPQTARILGLSMTFIAGRRDSFPVGYMWSVSHPDDPPGGQMRPADIVYFQDGVLPLRDPEAVPVVLKESEWRGHPVGVFKNKAISMSEMVLFVSNIHGGVHLGGSPSPLQQRMLREASAYLTSAEAGANLPSEVKPHLYRGGPLGAMIAIGWVTLEGMRPLYDALPSTIRDAAPPAPPP